MTPHPCLVSGISAGELGLSLAFGGVCDYLSAAIVAALSWRGARSQMMAYAGASGRRQAGADPKATFGLLKSGPSTGGDRRLCGLDINEIEARKINLIALELNSILF